MGQACIRSEHEEVDGSEDWAAEVAASRSSRAIVVGSQSAWRKWREDMSTMAPEPAACSALAPPPTSTPSTSAGQPCSAGGRSFTDEASPRANDMQVEGRSRTLTSWIADVEGLVGRGKTSSSGAQVTLHVYDVTGLKAVCSVNKILRRLGTGLFHCGVEVHGREWSYSDINAPILAKGATGVFSCQPGACEGHGWRESIVMGRTPLNEYQVHLLVESLKARWPVADYHTLSRNCCHFSDEFCRSLGVGSIPPWIVSLAGIGSGLLRVASGEVMLCCGNSEKEEAETYLCCPVQDKAVAMVAGCIEEVKTEDMNDIMYHL